MTINTLTPPRAGRPLTGRGVLLILLGFFGSVGAVNFYMARMALATFSGEVVDRPYETGLAYNKQIAAAHAQDALGWTMSAHVSHAADGKASIAIDPRDADGKHLHGLDVNVTFESPVDRARDVRTPLVASGDGVYRGATAIGAGVWDLAIDARKPDGKSFVSRSRINLD
jgi:nitrogen fixation protein FixH